MTWDDLWALYHNREDNMSKAEILAQIDWIHFIGGLAAKYQIEVLKNAPEIVVDRVKNKICLEARIKL